MKAKEKWIDETLNSLDGIARAKADSNLYKKVMEQAKHHEQSTSRLRPLYYWPAAAGLALLVTLNILAAIHYKSNNSVSQEVPAAVATEYLSYLGPIKL